VNEMPKERLTLVMTADRSKPIVDLIHWLHDYLLAEPGVEIQIKREEIEEVQA